MYIMYSHMCGGYIAGCVAIGLALKLILSYALVHAPNGLWPL